MTRRNALVNNLHGAIYNLNYQLHVEHLTAQLAQNVDPEDMSATLRRIEYKVSTGKASRIQAISREINKALA
ncbi:hypothetical protein [Glutamicibacter ardleyensis]|uniref:Uncharacterized protein n=1 Tax=Glutamicibacter ardleyensis TaxID=225894 RepID=A0ABQ2DF80_9MICC|nr:hypothetical protein [Glutamicibacter ardleyensis]GGJ55857.1 hypothetical protein GCM10007173_13390 [Glutamicibacter ardleyensis]